MSRDKMNEYMNAQQNEILDAYQQSDHSQDLSTFALLWIAMNAETFRSNWSSRRR